MAALALSAGGCATIFRPSGAKVSVDSDPHGAKVYVNGSLVGRAPMEVSLPGRESAAVEFRKRGYESRTVHLRKEIGALWLVLDILGGVIPIIVDAATGAWNNVEPSHVKVVLEQTDESTEAASAD